MPILAFQKVNKQIGHLYKDIWYAFVGSLSV